MTYPSDHTLDTCGLTCPEPVMLLHGAVRDALAGEVIKVRATDPATQRDIPNFCEFLGHPLLGVEATEKEYIFYIQKGV